MSIDNAVYEVKYVTKLEDLLREVMQIGGDIAIGEKTVDDWSELYKRAELHLASS